MKLKTSGICCPKCGGATAVVDTVGNSQDGEIYRRRRCVDCKHTLYTIEFEVIDNERFRREWTKLHRQKKGEGEEK